MAWFSDWEHRLNNIRALGLPALIVGVELLPPWDGYRLLALRLEVDEMYLPRSHEDRDFPLHITLAFEDEISVDLAVRALGLHRRWAGRAVLLRVGSFGSGGTANLAPNDALASDPDLIHLHGAGAYRNRPVHVSL
jgi:hypothetical protein